MEIGFRPLRYGQPVAGDHWKGGGLHYFLHANLSASSPMGVRRGVQLIVINDRLFDERIQDALILRVDGIFGEAHEDDNPVRARLRARIGAPYVRAMRATLTPRRAPCARPFRTWPPSCAKPMAPAAPRRALCLLAADDVVNKLSRGCSSPRRTGNRRRRRG